MFFNAVEVDLACFLSHPFLVVLDARGTKATSVGMTASDLYTRKNDEYPVTEMTWVQRPQMT
jgi:hypothetical protein